MLELRNLEVCYGEFQVLWGVSMSVAAGEIVCLLGPNGAGKSTVMNAITGLIARRGGNVSFACMSRTRGLGNVASRQCS